MSKKKNKEQTKSYWFRELFKTLPDIAKQSGYGLPRIAMSYAAGYILHSADSEKFRTLHLYEYSLKKRSTFIGNRATHRFSDTLNAAASAEDMAVMDDKHLFNTVFRDYIRRDWIYIPDSTPEQIGAFLDRNSAFLAKPARSTQGYGICKYITAELDRTAFLEQYRDKPFLLETFIRQHPALEALNPSTVNTARIQTIRKGDRVQVVGGCVRVGGSGATVDNFHQGGVAYPLDMDSGIVTAPGRRLTGEIFLRHPSSGVLMPGFQMPFWDQAVQMVQQAAVTPPHIGYVGWDVAFTQDGPELIEGNINYPDPIVFQLDGQGKYRMVRDFVEGT